MLFDYSRPVLTRSDIASQSIHSAAEKGDVDAVKKLVEEDLRQCVTLSNSVNVRDGLLRATPLHSASEEGNFNVAKYLIMSEADVSAEDRFGSTPLHFASDMGHHEIAKLLLCNGALVNCRNKASDTAMHWAAAKGRIKVIELLITEGGTIDAKNGKGWTPLHFSVAASKFDTVMLLIDKGANVNSQNSSGNTPLHVACMCNNTGMVDFLLKCGARRDALNKNKLLPSDLASQPIIKYELLQWKKPEKRKVIEYEHEKTPKRELPPVRAILHEVNKVPLDSPEPFQDRIKRLAKEKKADEKLATKKEARRNSSWNKKFLKRYGLAHKNLFAP